MQRALRCASRLKVPLLPFNPKSKIRNPKSEIRNLKSSACARLFCLDNRLGCARIRLK